MIDKHSEGPPGYSAVFEDDGKVAHAYLLHERRIVADVWLYNRSAAPEAPNWRDPSSAPFLNPRAYASSEPFPPVTDESEVDFDWSSDAAGSPILRILIRGEDHARLVPGSKPGWSRLAAKDGPLARRQ
jgi:hypothetical protein